MKRIIVFSFAIGLAAISFNCKEKSESTISLTREVTFTKDGEASLLKAENDSLVAVLNIEIADNDYKTQTGLMYRSSMKKDEAMLFIFPDEQIRTFYMKNTEIPLDIIYFDSSRKLINIQKNARPYDESSLPSEAPAKYVLEVNAGLTDTWNLEKGDLLQFERN